MSGRRTRQEYNIVLLGALGVGKSALTVKYITKRFIIEYDPYIEDIYTKQESLDGQEFIVNVMDTYEKDDSHSHRYLKWADGFMIVYSITDRNSFERAKDYFIKVSDYLRTSSKDCPIALIGNKIDLERYRQISRADGQSVASEFDALFYECNAAEEYEYVEDIFHGLVHGIQQERGERCIPYQPLFISEERFRSRPRSPRNSSDKKDDKSGSKKNTSSFKLFNKSFKIFN